MANLPRPTTPPTRSASNPDTGSRDAGGPSDLGSSGYPPQLHAGKVGYGPMYHQGADFYDKVGGLKEEIIGKIRHKPDMVQRGRERRSGVAKQKELENEPDPFATPADSAGGPRIGSEKGDKARAATTAPRGIEAGEAQKKRGRSEPAISR